MILFGLLIFILLTLAFVHFNWAVGGKFGFDIALPTDEKGVQMLHPKKIDSALVGVALMLFAVFYFLKAPFIAYDLPDWVLTSFGWIIPSIFTVRAIGDFKYLGFFKKVKTTSFGKADTRCFSPLCLFIGVTGFIVQIYM